MAAIKSKNSRAELLLRSALHRLGVRFRLHAGDLPGRPDIVFRKLRVVVFVDGDFWHARLLRERGPTVFRQSLKTANQEYWIKKFASRVERDDAVGRELSAGGWRVVRLWESEVCRDPASCAETVRSLLRDQRNRADEASQESQGWR